MMAESTSSWGTPMTETPAPSRLFTGCDHRGLIVPMVFRDTSVPNPRAAEEGQPEVIPITVLVQAICINPTCRHVFKFELPNEGK